MGPHDVEILLVEDDPRDAELTIRALKKRGLANRLHHVLDGAAAVDFLFAEGAYAGRDITAGPKVVLLDLNVPKVAGVDVLRRIRADERTRGIPVVALTSSDDRERMKECYDLGVNSYLVKPVEFDHFSRVVAELGFYWILVNRPPS